MSGDLSINGVSFDVNKQKIQNNDTGINDSSENNSIFPAGTSKAGDVSAEQKINNQSAIDSAQSAKEPAFKTDIEAFDKMNVPADATPQKEVNGVKIFAAGSKEKIDVLNSNGNVRIVLGSSGQRIDLPAGEMQSKGASIVYDGKTIALNGLNNATVKGIKDDETHKQYVGNKILAKNCNNSTFDLNDKVNGWSDSRDTVVMDNCKSAKVVSGQNNIIVAMNGTKADVAYSSVAGKAAEDDPTKDWINKFHTYYAADESSSVTCSKNGTVNRDSHNPLIQDLVSHTGEDGKEASFQKIDGKTVTAHEFLLDVINKDAKNPDNTARPTTIDSSGLGGRALKIPTKTLASQLDHLMNGKKIQED